MSASSSPQWSIGSTNNNHNAGGGGMIGSTGSVGGNSFLSQQQQHHQQQQQVVAVVAMKASSYGNEFDELLPFVLQLTNTQERETALLELSKRRESFIDLAPVLWHSFGTIAALLQEIVSIYSYLNPPTLTAHSSNRVCNALALLQCVASHPETRQHFLKAHIPMYLYPFLNTSSKSRPFEYLRLTSLGVIGALVKMDDPEVINFLLSTEIIPLCLRIMENGTELSRTVATFIIQKVLLDSHGLAYICETYERFKAIAEVLSSMLASLEDNNSARLLKHIVRCYLRLCDNIQAREALSQDLPSSLKDDTYRDLLQEDPAVQKWLEQLLKIVGANSNNHPNTSGGGNLGSTSSTMGVVGGIRQ